MLRDFPNALDGSNDDTAWYDIIGKLKEKSIQFNNELERLLNRQSEVEKYPTLSEEYNDLINRAGKIKKSIKKITGGVDTVSSWIKKIFGNSGLEEISQVGIIPFIPIAVIAGSITLIGKWVKDAYTMNKKIDEAKRLESTGMSPAQAAKIVENYGSMNLFKNLGSFIPVIIFIGGAFILWPQIKKRLGN